MDKSGKYWGTTRKIFHQNNLELHYLEIMDMGYCSEHLHKHKYNKFVVLDGALQIHTWKSGEELPPDVVTLYKYDSHTVCPGIYHKFINNSNKECKLLEIYWTELDSNDIVRRSIGGQFG